MNPLKIMAISEALKNLSYLITGLELNNDEIKHIQKLVVSMAVGIGQINSNVMIPVDRTMEITKDLVEQINRALVIDGNEQTKKYYEELGKNKKNLY